MSSMNLIDLFQIVGRRIRLLDRFKLVTTSAQRIMFTYTLRYSVVIIHVHSFVRVVVVCGPLPDVALTLQIVYCFRKLRPPVLLMMMTYNLRQVITHHHSDVCVCVCYSVVTKTKQQDSFYFDPSPINQNVVEGSEALLRCDVSNRRQIMFYWTLNGRQLANTSRRHQIDSDLIITRVDRAQDTGSFRCIATNVTTGIALRSTEARLNISCTCNICLCLSKFYLYHSSVQSALLEEMSIL